MTKLSVCLFVLSVLKIVQNSYDCDSVILNSTSGAIMSPDYSTTNSSELICRWEIYSRHNLLHLKIAYVDIGSCSDCCDFNYFKVSNERQELARYCNNKEVQDVVLNESLIILDFRAKFYSSRNKGIKFEYNFVYKTCEESQFKCADEELCISKQSKCNTVFDCEDHSDEVNCTYCPVGQAACDYISTFCFSPLLQRCDGVVDCPGAEDELNCFSGCPSKLRCGNSLHCYEKKQHCDRNYDCINGYDEKNCSHLSCEGPFNIQVHFICRNGRCIDRSYLNDGLDDCGDGSDEFAGKNTNYIVLATFIGIFMSVVFIFLICRWFLTRRNINYLMANPPEFPRRRRDSDNVYNECDFRRGGAIFEAYLQSRIERDRQRKGSNDSKSKIDTNPRTRNRRQLVVAPREVASAVETKRNVDSQANLERLVFENFVQKKNLSDSSDFSPPSGDDLSLGEDFSPKVLMEAHEEKCLLCKSQITSNTILVAQTRSLEVKSNVYLMDRMCEHTSTLSKYKSDSNLNNAIPNNFDDFKKNDVTVNRED